jgi:two-component system OmpR family response regulator
MARILVVDDDPPTREQLRLHLAFAGFDVATAADGIEAGYAILEAWPDLIVCDIDMPHLDGPGLQVLLASDPSIPEIPIFFLTAEDPVRTRERIGSGQFFAKPVSPGPLLAAVREGLMRHVLDPECLVV